MSEMLAIFSIIVGFALLLTGIGLVILARAVFGRAGAEMNVAPPRFPERPPDNQGVRTRRSLGAPRLRCCGARAKPVQLGRP